MYRKPGSQSVLSGVPSGPFTGGRRVLDAQRLAPSTRQKLARALHGIGEPSPIAKRQPYAGLWRAVLGWALITISAAIFVAVFAEGYHEAASTWARQPLHAMPIYLGAGALLASGVLLLVRRRLLLGGDALPPGTYLLPLDIVEVSAPDAAGAQTLTVLSLGDARDAAIEQKGKRTEVVISIDGGTVERFVLRGDKTGERTMIALERSQNLLEKLSYTKDVERSFLFDVFFDLRIDESWAAVSPESMRGGARREAASASTKAKRDERRFSALIAGFLQRPIAVAFALVFGTMFGAGVFHVRRTQGDNFLFNRAAADSDPEAFTRYIEQGGLRRQDAEQARTSKQELQRLLQEADKRSEARDASKKNVDFVKPEECLAALRAATSPAHPHVLRIMETIVNHRRDGTTGAVPILFKRKLGARPSSPDNLPSLAALDAELDQRERVFASAFGRIFSETCPASVIQFTSMPAGLDAFVGDDDHLTIAYEIAWLDETRGVTTEGGSTKVRPFKIDFDVSLAATGLEPETFHLALPPPAQLTTNLRPRSLYVLKAKAADTVVDGGSPGAERVYSALTARAFDRVYDEVYSLFFDGDPRVPLRAGDSPNELDGFGAKPAADRTK